jgi:hypothetical protein
MFSEALLIVIGWLRDANLIRIVRNSALQSREGFLQSWPWQRFRGGAGKGNRA